jgi:hypothetical protein
MIRDYNWADYMWADRSRGALADRLLYSIGSGFKIAAYFFGAAGALALPTGNVPAAIAFAKAFAVLQGIGSALQMAGVCRAAFAGQLESAGKTKEFYMLWSFFNQAVSLNRIEIGFKSRSRKLAATLVR